MGYVNGGRLKCSIGDLCDVTFVEKGPVGYGNYCPLQWLTSVFGIPV